MILNKIEEWVFMLGLFNYTFSIISIIISQEFKLSVACVIYIGLCFPNFVGLSITLHVFSSGTFCLLSILLLKYTLILGIEAVPYNFYFCMLTDVVLCIMFLFLAYLREKKTLTIKQKVIPIISKQISPESSAESSAKYELCSICLESMENNLVQTVCKHIFHEKCLTEWNKRNIMCPLCRHDLAKEML